MQPGSLLLLDEATSALDTVSEAVIQRALQELTVGRTSLVIAHRLSTVIDADKIIVMAEGRIVASGRHEDLMAHSDLYRELASRQQLMVSFLEVIDGQFLLPPIHMIAGQK